MTTLEIANYAALNIKDKLIITSDVNAGITSIPVVNSEGVGADNYLVLGQLGSDYSEPLQAAHTGFAPDHTHIVVSAATVAGHKEFDPLWVLYGNQIRIYRAPNVDGTYPADSSYTLLDTIDIDFDNTSTEYQDAAGSSAYWYKVTYYNSTAATETDLANSPINLRGGDYGTYTTIANIRREAGLVNNEFITDSDIDSQRFRAQYEIDGALAGMYSVPFQPPINPMIATLTEKLASSKLLAIDYGPMASGNSKDADKKLTEYERLMEKIDSKNYVLTDTNGNDLSIAGAGGNKAWPNSTTDSTPVDQGGSNRTFRMGMRF